MSRRSALSVIGLGAVSVLASCDLSLQGQGNGGQVEVSGEFGTTPQVEFRPPLRVSAPYTEEILTGSGQELRDGSALMLSYLAIDAITGRTLSENFQNPPEIMMLGEEAGVLYPELLGRAEGSRILRVETGTRDRPNPTVLTYDIRHTSAWGDPVDPPEDEEKLPVVEVDDEGVPRVEVPDADPPSDLQIIPVRRGDGPQVRPGHAITVRYSTLSWSSGEVTDTLWGEGTVPTTIPFTGLIPAWQDGLVDEQAGSRVMLITPPDQAFGTETLVFLIDVLAVSVQEGEDVDALRGEEGRPEKDDGESGPQDEDAPEDEGEEGVDG